MSDSTPSQPKRSLAYRLARLLLGSVYSLTSSSSDASLPRSDPRERLRHAALALTTLLFASAVGTDKVRTELGSLESGIEACAASGHLSDEEAAQLREVSSDLSRALR